MIYNKIPSAYFITIIIFMDFVFNVFVPTKVIIINIYSLNIYTVITLIIY